MIQHDFTISTSAGTEAEPADEAAFTEPHDSFRMNMDSFKKKSNEQRPLLQNTSKIMFILWLCWQFETDSLQIRSNKYESHKLKDSYPPFSFKHVIYLQSLYISVYTYIAHNYIHIIHQEQVVCFGDGLWLNWTLWWPGMGEWRFSVHDCSALQCICRNEMEWTCPSCPLKISMLVRPNFSPFRSAFWNDESLRFCFCPTKQQMVPEWFMNGLW